MSALGHKWTNHHGTKFGVVCYCQKGDIHGYGLECPLCGQNERGRPLRRPFKIMGLFKSEGAGEACAYSAPA